MKEVQFYKYAAGALLLLNLTILAFFLLNAPPPPRQPGDKAQNFLSRATEILQLDKEQRISFEQFAKKHKQQMDSLAREQNALLKPYFQSIVAPSEHTSSPAILDQVLLLEQEKISTTLHHFQDIKSMLNEDQQVDFEHFMNQALELILLKSGQGNRPH